MRQTAFPLAVALALAACENSPKSAPAIVLPPARDTIVVAYTDVGAGAPLPDGRWLIIAPNEHLVAALDFTSHSYGGFGGERHPDYQEPFGLFLLGDSIHLADWGMRRVTIWTADGKMTRSLPAADLVRGALPTARDGQGNFYVEIHPPAGSDGSGNLDSAVVVRVKADFSAADTVARLAPPELAEVEGDPSGRRYEPRAMSGRDRWGVLPNGSVWVARVNQNRVVWRSPDGRWTRGQMLLDRALLVEDGDREMFLKQFPEELRRNAERVPFAVTKPPFSAAFTGPGGNVWLVKNWAMEDTTRQVQVVGRDGKLVHTYQIPRWGRFLAASENKALVAESFEKGYRMMLFDLPPDTGPRPN